MQGVGAEQMNAGEQPVIGMSDVFPEPGTFTVQVCNSLSDHGELHIGYHGAKLASTLIIEIG